MRGARGVLLVAAAVITTSSLRLCHAREHGDALPHAAPLHPIPAEVCESKTINYITHTLPQQCLRTSWSSANSSLHANTTESAAAASPEPTLQNGTQPEHTAEAKVQEDVKEGTKEGEASEPGKEDKGGGLAREEDSQDLATSSFMSFEEWKALQLKKAGQDPAELNGRKRQENKGEAAYPGPSNGDLDSLGDDGEIALDFDTLSEKVSEIAASAGPNAEALKGEAKSEDAVLYDDGRTQYYRSKDAGKTCKERFSYTSFDAGATILKTSSGAKNAKAILVENKDSYMLLECSTENKFVIVEMSDDILVDTVVLANFEFFSSMIRKFRVSVSDRFPVKIDKWKELGTFEARNSRDIQPFLVEHPQIWAKYIRLEFLTHSGNEYYCPVSLLRVHGTRMLDSWKESEGAQDDDEEAVDPAPVEQTTPEAAEALVTEPAQANLSETVSRGPDYVTEAGLSPWYPLFFTQGKAMTCATASPTTTETPQDSPLPQSGETMPSSSSDPEPPPSTLPPSAGSASGEPVPTTSPAASVTDSETTSSSSVPPANVSLADPSQAGYGANSTSAGPDISPSSSPTQPGSASKPPASETPSTSSKQATSQSSSSRTPNTKSHTTTVIPKPSTSPIQAKNRTASPNPPIASPTVQESFFKTVTKRLQHLESNTTLSLQYIEDQSRFLQEALLKMERKQISRVDSFLDSLNKTVLSELRNVRQQYDQIWQSTVIALETQREQSQREIVALSERLSVLGDEVVFQKRMAILQSVLLLSCLVLVIFSRSLAGSATALDLALHHPGASASTTMLAASPPPSAAAPRYPNSPSPSPSRKGTGAKGGRRASRSARYPDKVLPLTPTSDYGGEATPPAILVEGPGSSYMDDPGDFTPNRSRLGVEAGPQIGGGLVDGSSRGTSTTSSDESFGSDQAAGDGGDTGEDCSAEPDVLLAPSSSLSHVSSAGRKPLPALPEDPS